MIEARAQREQELVQLILAERASLVRIYEFTTGQQAASRTPNVATCLEMVREILQIELPLAGGAVD